ncbi:MAG: sigma-70 family RNA polymerase sigma factor [Chloroflexota bacterium]|nr:sigma-70 family RNA polymerase sigma factor [Chloroflexota bacterium]
MSRAKVSLRRNTTRLLSPSAERELVRSAQAKYGAQSERAVDGLIKAFRPFLRARVAKFERAGVDAADLEQEARIGFVRAVERYDLARPERLSTYAELWVDGALRRYVSRQRLIHVPQRVGQELGDLRSQMTGLSDVLGREATLGELARESGTDAARIEELLAIPEAVVSLTAIENGEAGATPELRPGDWARRAAVLADEVEEEVTSANYDTGELGTLLDEYQGLRSQLEVRTSDFGEPRLRRRGNRTSNLVRLADLDHALQRVSGRQFVALELAGLRDLPLRELEALLSVRHTTFADRKKAGLRWMCSWLNEGTADCSPRRLVWWRRLFAWNLGELWIQGEPVAFEVWGRLMGAEELWTGERTIPIRPLAAFGEGWLLTPELLGRDIDWDEDEGLAATG